MSCHVKFMQIADGRPAARRPPHVPLWQQQLQHLAAGCRTCSPFATCLSVIHFGARDQCRAFHNQADAEKKTELNWASFMPQLTCLLSCPIKWLSCIIEFGLQLKLITCYWYKYLRAQTKSHNVIHICISLVSNSFVKCATNSRAKFRSQKVFTSCRQVLTVELNNIPVNIPVNSSANIRVNNHINRRANSAG